MTVNDEISNSRSYGCTYGCGRPYDVILINVADGTTEFLCMVDFVTVASTVVKAMTEAASPEVAAALAYAASHPAEQAPGPAGKPGRRNAPANSADDDMFAEYDEMLELSDIADMS